MIGSNTVIRAFGSYSYTCDIVPNRKKGHYVGAVRKNGKLLVVFTNTSAQTIEKQFNNYVKEKENGTSK